MTTTKIDHRNGVLRICVDRLEGSRAEGRVVSRRLTAPMAFSDLGGLLLQLEALLERQNFPQAFQRMRSFTSETPEYPAGLLPPLLGDRDAVAAQILLVRDLLQQPVPL